MKRNLTSIATVFCLIFAILCLTCSCGGSDNKQDATGASQVTDADKPAETEADKIDDVIAGIDAIGTVSLESKAKIDEAKKLYNALSSSEKEKVSNYSVLEAAETQYKALAKAEKDKVLENHKSKFEADHDKVENITWYYPLNMPEYIDERSYIIPYIGVQNDNMWICVRYNYTEDDWVFWESLTIVADGEKFVKYVGPFNTVRDNDGGVVWEWYDDALDLNAAMDTKELQNLEKIANAKETIIRFQGDEYSYDLTVSEKDKAMIRDVLAMYSEYIKY